MDVGPNKFVLDLLNAKVKFYFRHCSLPLSNFTQWKDKCASYSFTTNNLTHSVYQVSLVVKYT